SGSDLDPLVQQRAYGPSENDAQMAVAGLDPRGGGGSEPRRGRARDEQRLNGVAHGRCRRAVARALHLDQRRVEERQQSQERERHADGEVCILDTRRAGDARPEWEPPALVAVCPVERAPSSNVTGGARAGELLSQSTARRARRPLPAPKT